MLKYRRMKREEFETIIEKDVLESYIEDLEIYLEEFLKTSKGLTPREYAVRQFKELLPSGVESPNNFLWIALNEESDEKIGFIWFTNMIPQKINFLSYIEVDEQFRGRGFGTEMIQKWEHHIQETYPEIAALFLHVFIHNPKAKKLYERLGFKIHDESYDGWNMKSFS